MSVQIYAGNLSYSMSEDNIKDLFSQYGPVTSVKIITDRESGRSKGFGFVEMAEKDDAEKAIAQLNGSEVLNRQIRVNYARPKRPREA